MWYNGAGGDFLTHLLVVDDEVSILELIKNSLGKDGYLITVCQNADDVDIKKLHFYDLILLDVMMPGTDGFEFCKQIRNMVDCPILFLTAKTLEEDILFGLGIGADDYITKPFRIQELRARVAAHLRREKREHHSILSFEPDIRFDLSAKVLYVSEQPVPLTKSWGLFSNAIAIPSRCFIPRENCPARFLPVFVSWTICNTSLIRASSRPSNVVLTLRFSYAVRFS